MYGAAAFLRRLAFGYSKLRGPLRFFQKFRANSHNPVGEYQTDFAGGYNYARHTHQFRSSAFKFAGYGLGSLITITICPIILWPLADTYILPSVICQTLTKTSNYNNVNCKNNESKLWGREYELEQLKSMMYENANNIWILTGGTNSGKTALIKELSQKESGVIYIDLRHFFDGNAFVFEMIDSLYNNKHNGNGMFGTFSKLVGTYVKLFCFITAIMAQSNHQVTAMLYFHAILNHVRAGLVKYHQKYLCNGENEKGEHSLPLIVFDHFEALPAALRHCEIEKNREMLSFIIYSISQFSSSICHDNGLSHVLFIGDEYFTMKKSDLDINSNQFTHDNDNDNSNKSNKYGKHKIENSESFLEIYNKVINFFDDSAMNRVGCMEHLSPSIYNHCEYWSIGGIEYNTAVDWLFNNWNEKLKLKLNSNDDTNNENNRKLYQLSKKLIDCIGNKPFTIESMSNATVNNIVKDDGSIDDKLNQLSSNIDQIVEMYNNKFLSKLNKVMKCDLISNHIGSDKFDKELNEFGLLLKNLKNEFAKSDIFGNDNKFKNDCLTKDITNGNLLYQFMDHGLVSRHHGPMLAKNKEQLNNYQFRRCTSDSNSVGFVPI